MVGPTGILGRHQELPSLPCARPWGLLSHAGGRALAAPRLPPMCCLLLSWILPCLLSLCHTYPSQGPLPTALFISALSPSLSPDTVASWFLTPTWMTVSSLSHQLQAGRDGLSHCRPLVPSLSLHLVGAFASMCRQERGTRQMSLCLSPDAWVGFLSLPL